MNTTRTLLLMAGTALCVCTSCSDDGPGAPAADKNLGRFEYNIGDSEDSLFIRLDRIQEPVERIESTLGWVDIRDNGTDRDGNVQLKLVRLAETPARFVTDSAYIHFRDNRRATLVITADKPIRPLSDNAAGEYEAFNREWWKQEEILYTRTRTINGQIESTSEHIPLPWAPATTSNVPSSLFFHDPMTTNEGWVMAYNLFAAETNGNPNSKPYFILYNKYTGTLRTFYYQAEHTGTGGEFLFLVTPDDDHTAKYPYYHTMQYAIPVGNKDVQLQGNVTGITRANNTFQQMVTPYLKDDIVLKRGWYCFDLDWSAYRPSGDAPFLALDRLGITCLTANNANITLAGTFTGTSEGTVETTTNSSTSTANGLNYLDQFNSGISNVTGALESFMSGNYLKGVFMGGLSLYNFHQSMSGSATDDYTTVAKSTGSINMSHSGQVNMDGYSTSSTSNDAIGVDFSYTAFSQDKDVAKGVWSLQDNPVVYVVNDRLMGEDEDFVCTVGKDGYPVGSEDPSANNLRLMTFLDPTTIKFNLNTAAFKDIREVEMSWMYGVMPNQPFGHTNNFRHSLMQFSKKGLFEEPVFIDKKAHEGEVYKSFSSDFAKMQYVWYPVEDMTTTQVDASTKPKEFKQNGTGIRYYGRAGNSRAETDKEFFVVDPIVYLPTEYLKDKDEEGNEEEYGTGMVYDFRAPDFVVGVTLTFKHTQPDGTEAKCIFSQRFVPGVKSISTAEMLKKRDALRRYVEGDTHQTIGNVSVKHRESATMLKQFFSTAEYLEKYEFE